MQGESGLVTLPGYLFINFIFIYLFTLFCYHHYCMRASLMNLSSATLSTRLFGLCLAFVYMQSCVNSYVLSSVHEVCCIVFCVW